MESSGDSPGSPSAGARSPGTDGGAEPGPRPVRGTAAAAPAPAPGAAPLAARPRRRDPRRERYLSLERGLAAKQAEVASLEGQRESLQAAELILSIAMASSEQHIQMLSQMGDPEGAPDCSGGSGSGTADDPGAAAPSGDLSHQASLTSSSSQQPLAAEAAAAAVAGERAAAGAAAALAAAAGGLPGPEQAFVRLAAPQAVIDQAIDDYLGFLDMASQDRPAPGTPSSPAVVDAMLQMHERMRPLHVRYPLLRQQLLTLDLSTRSAGQAPEGHWARAIEASRLSHYLSRWSRLQIKCGLWVFDAAAARLRNQRIEIESQLAEVLAHQQGAQHGAHAALAAGGGTTGDIVDPAELLDSLEASLRRELVMTNVFLSGGGHIMPRQYIAPLLVAGMPYWPCWETIARALVAE